MHDLNNPDQIEREIEKDREALRRTLDDLQGELSLDGLSRRLTGSVRKNGAEWVEAASYAARANPIALGLTGIGLAWMIFGRGQDTNTEAFFAETGLTPDEVHFIEPNDFLRITNGSFPVILELQDGAVQNAYNYRNLH